MSATEFYGSLLATGIVLVVVALISWQWLERRRRGPGLSDDDRSHFFRQDLRRGFVAVVMTLLALGIYYGSWLPHRVNGRPSLLFVKTWLAVYVLSLILVILALLDWLATRRYAARHRSAIVREGIEIISDELKMRASRQSDGRVNGAANGAIHD